MVAIEIAEFGTAEASVVVEAVVVAAGVGAVALLVAEDRVAHGRYYKRV